MRRREGHRYEFCRLCGREWNVPLDLKIDELEGYICPQCYENVVKPQMEWYDRLGHGKPKKRNSKKSRSETGGHNSDI